MAGWSWMWQNIRLARGSFAMEGLLLQFQFLFSLPLHLMNLFHDFPLQRHFGESRVLMSVSDKYIKDILLECLQLQPKTLQEEAFHRKYHGWILLGLDIRNIFCIKLKGTSKLRQILAIRKVNGEWVTFGKHCGTSEMWQFKEKCVW